MASILNVFNEHFVEFINDIQSVFPDDVDIVTAKNSISLIRKSNPKLLPKIWVTYIVSPYLKEIEKGDISFFLSKDYSNDLVKNDSYEKIMESIDRLRGPIKNMTKENQDKTMKYIQNLSKLALLIE